ncbi:hypothetical protein F53441_11186 [Fusarium austroafricanum]|uniref:Xylanolytic transcriptional activator regulatory domain-containing protein n=1 Tax=Fusarium austroafricanum TaxID=2364996 RepID=A0A8H4K7K2_9HYPO|nr:hypothetical protein F53441_11186 [Fusarium austroafricanum]
MAGRIAALERSLANATIQKDLGINSTGSNNTPEAQSLNGFLVQQGSSDQYFNEILVARVIGQEKDIETELSTSSDTQTIDSSSAFDTRGILSCPSHNQSAPMFHPEKAVAIDLWNVYLSKVEICIGLKITHVPTDEIRVYSTISDPLHAKVDDLAFCYSIYFAATVASDSQTAQLHRYKSGLEQAFAQGDFLNSPTLTGLRALAIYLSAIRVHNRGKAVWILNGLATRIAESLGLHRDGAKLGLSCFDSELRRRLWWHLITRDSRAGEDYGLDDPSLLISTSDVKLPVNIDDTDIYPEAKELPPEKAGWTGMTFSLVNINLAQAMEKLKTVSTGPNPSEKERKQIIQELRTRIHNRLEKCNPVTPHQRLTVHCSEFLLQKLDFFTRQQWLLLRHGHSSDMIETEETLLIALNILEARVFGEDPFLAQFSWAKKAHPQYHVTLYILWYLCFQPESPHAERAWRAIDRIYAQEMSAGGGGVKPIVITALKAKAEGLRKNLGFSGQSGMEETDVQALDHPLRFFEGLNFDEQVFDGANRGIGYAIVQAIGTRLPSSNIILACRTKDAAEEAIKSLHAGGITAQLDYVELDIESDASIEAAVASLERDYGRLDEQQASDNLSDIRSASNSCFNNLITSNAIMTHAFSKLLKKSSWPRVIMISSTRGSMSKTVNKELPPVANIDYCVSKAGLNMLTLHLQATENNSDSEPKVTFWTVNPGHCATAFNGYRGKKDPLEGAEVIMKLLESKKEEIEPGTFWQYENGSFDQIPW